MSTFFKALEQAEQERSRRERDAGSHPTAADVLAPPVPPAVDARSGSGIGMDEAPRRPGTVDDAHHRASVRGPRGAADGDGRPTAFPQHRHEPDGLAQPESPAIADEGVDEHLVSLLEPRS